MNKETIVRFMAEFWGGFKASEVFEESSETLQKRGEQMLTSPTWPESKIEPKKACAKACLVLAEMKRAEIGEVTSSRETIGICKIRRRFVRSQLIVGPGSHTMPKGRAKRRKRAMARKQFPRWLEAINHDMDCKADDCEPLAEALEPITAEVAA